MSLVGFGVKNLRCLTDTGIVPIKPISLLVGRNSSGKSTYLRAFPLLRQSVENFTESPILWFLEHRVDFGSLANAINDEAGERALTFKFSVCLPKSAGVMKDEPVVNVAVTLAAEPPPRGVSVQSYEIECVGHTASLRFTPTGKLVSFLVNGTDVFPHGAELSLGGRAFLLPTLYSGDDGKVSYQPFVVPASGTTSNVRPAPDPLRDALNGALKAVLRAPPSDETLNIFEYSLRIGTPETMWATLIWSVHWTSLKDDFFAEGAGGSRFAAIIRHAVAHHLPWILDAVDQHVADFMSRVAYLAPLRATAERTYRLKDSAVSDVDPDGTNLAMFLRSLSEPEMQSFAAFTREHLGFESSIRESALHAEILVKEPGKDRALNLVDIGFGYTEVLPLMAILWSTCCRKPRAGVRPTSLLAIEQPELHLHPAHQVKLASVIAGAFRASRDAGREVNIMVETHSEGLINGLGELIRKGVVKASDVQIVLFDQDGETRQTTVRLAGYTDDGALDDAWPFGFFAPVADD